MSCRERSFDTRLILLLFASVAGCGAEPQTAPLVPPVRVELPRAADCVAAPVAATRTATVTAPLQAAESDPVPFHCADGELLIAGDRPYCVQKQATSFHGSEQWCASNGGYLARIESDDEGRALQKALGSAINFDKDTWFGLVEPRPGHWLWSTGAAVGVTHWRAGEPNNAGGNEACGMIYPNAEWNDLACDRRLPYLCESRSARAGAAPGKLKCNGTAFRAGGIAYCYDTSREVAWIDGEHACKAQGGTLASFTTREEIEAFEAAVAARIAEGRAWIGFTDEGYPSRWTTVTGRPAAYTHWRAGEPNNAGGNEHCAEWYSADAGWNDARCDLSRVGICAPR